MRRTAAHASLAVAVVLAVAACGSSSGDYKNDPRPPAPIVITGYISDQRVSVSPRSLGAGPISLIVTNQVTAPISPRDTATLKVDVKPGSYSVHVGGDAIHAARLKVGPERASAQNDLLQP